MSLKEEAFKTKIKLSLSTYKKYSDINLSTFNTVDF